MTQPYANGNAAGSGRPTEGPEATLIGVVLDRSGSMNAVREPTISGFNEFLHGQQRLATGGRALMSLTQFDDRFEVNFVGEPIETLPDLDTHSYVPRGSTALFDAIGRTVLELEAWTSTHVWKERVLVLIITDGQENASTEYDARAISALIEQKEKDGWNFAYMGANQDSFEVAGSLSIRRDFTANYDSSLEGTLANYQRMTSSTAAYRAARAKGQAAANFFGSSNGPSGKTSGIGTLRPKGAGGATGGGQRRLRRAWRIGDIKEWCTGRHDGERGH